MKGLLKEKEVAQMIGVSPTQLRLSRHTGELFVGVPGPKFVKFQINSEDNSGAIRYKRETVDAWLADLSRFERQKT